MWGAGTEFADNSAARSEGQTESNEGRYSFSALSYLWDWFFKKDTNKDTERKQDSTLPQLELTGRGTCQASSVHLAMGNPSNATKSESNRNNYLEIKDQYAMSYSSDRKTPNWVSWQLNEDWFGNVRRTGAFAPDDSLPDSFEKATPNDYKGSGYDRGHNVPSGDRTRTRADNESTFLMSNITPQASDNNQGPWEKLESYSRELVRQGKELYIIAGSNGSKGEIGNGVNVPENFWKVIVVLPQKGLGVAAVNEKTEVIAVNMPNVNGIRNDDWRKYLTTVSAIERHTGYDLLSCLPDDVENAVSVKKYGSP